MGPILFFVLSMLSGVFLTVGIVGASIHRTEVHENPTRPYGLGRWAMVVAAIGILLIVCLFFIHPPHSCL